MSSPTKKLVRMLDADQPLDVRCAAALVLGELGGRDAEVNRALLACLDDENPALRVRAIEAAGKLHAEIALPKLLERIKHGGEEAELAAKSAARLGAKGTKALQEMLHKVVPGVRRYIAAALTGGSGSVDVSVLLDRDQGIVEAAATSLLQQVPSLTPKQRGHLTGDLLELVGKKKKKAPLLPVNEVAVVRVLAALDDERAAPVFWERTLPPHPGPVRAAALQALGKWVEEPGKEEWKRLFTCAGESDFRLVAPALMILQRLPVQKKMLDNWVALFRAPDVSARKLALEKTAGFDSAELAESLLEQISHVDRELREGSLARLANLEHGRKALTKALLKEESVDRTWMLARAQAPFAKQYPVKWREEVFAQVCKYLEANDRRADPLLFLLREAEPAELRDHLEERAIAWRKKKEYAKALQYLKLLARDPACGFATRLELATCGLKLSSHELALEARNNDPCLHQFTILCQQDEEELLKQIEKMKWLDPEDLYYLGFHFAESGGKPQEFGAGVLRLLIKRSPKTKLAQAAKSKLRTAGVG
jgi:HEAT repeat protein